MKNPLQFFLAFIFLLCGKAQAQCPPGDFTLSSQLDIDLFGIYYPNCTEIGGNLTIQVLVGPPEIFDLSPLSNLETIAGELKIWNTQLTSLSGLHNITSTGGLNIAVNQELTSLSALSELTSVTGWIQVASNHMLTSLEGLENITEVGDVNLVFSNNLTSLSGLDNLTSVGGYLAIGGNPLLASISALDNLTSVEDNLIVAMNPALISLSGLDNLETVGGVVSIYENPLFTSLSGINNLTSAGAININTNNSLTSLSGLENLTSLFSDGHIHIYNNLVLTDISALQNLNPENILPIASEEYVGLYIVDNPLLEVCNLSNICTFLQNGGESEITGNAGSCIDEQTLTNACSMSVEDNVINNVDIYPNPVKSLLYFDKEIQKVTVTDLTGKIFSVQNTVDQVDLSTLQSGIYLIVIEQENGIQVTKKVIKE
jgi:hypothetical protein